MKKEEGRRKREEGRSGSALLIVLGMLSFMVVSAVGFSIYMRSGRQPSSYLRRNLVARGLVKSALARAIDELDGVWYKASDGFGRTGFVGVYDDPYPGCLPSGAPGYGNPAQNGDQWLNRVFMPLGAVDDEADTVPTLTFEALAYLPPAIIDDVRTLSRRTRTALWHSLPYDSGRYAYCAVNVSDLFDINRLRANKVRNSSANGRVTLASLCCTSYDDPMSVSATVASELDGILDRAKTLGKANGNATPFTSLADFNFVVGPNSEWAPFFDYVGKGGGVNMLKSASTKSANAMFITDTWFPATNNVAGTDFDLEAPSAQPFLNLQSANTFLDVVRAGVLNKTVASGHTVAAGTIFEKNLGVGLVCLHDYLDRDNLPLSLALPTTEVVPMVVGISSPGGIVPELGVIGSTQNAKVNGIVGTHTDNDGNQTPVNGIVVDRKYTLYGITSFGNNVAVKVVLVSPFKRLRTTNRAKQYSMRGLLRVWAAPDGMGCRPTDANGILYPDQAVWRNGVKNGVATFISDTKTISSFPDVNGANDATVESVLTFSSLNVNMPLYYNVEESINTPDSETATGLSGGSFAASAGETKAQYKSFGNIKDNGSAFCPLTVQGMVDTAWKAKTDASKFEPTKKLSNNGMTEFDPAADIATPYRLYAALWVQVLDGNEVVDMVPAGLKDDSEWLGANLPDANDVQNILGGDTPLMNFKGLQPFTFATIDTQLPQAFSSLDGWKALYAVDPRFNFAPEDWFGSSASAVATKSEWIQLLGLDGNTSTILGQNGRDRDIFMFVSDQEYLQSIGELQFLPYLQDMNGSGGVLSGRQYSPDFHGKAWDVDGRTGPVNGTFANGGRFWRTYTAYNNGNGYDPIYSLPYGGKEYVFESGRGGFKLNPYSSDQRVVFAGLIGTPFDYYMASTNTVVNSLVRNLDLNEMMSTYSFSKNVQCAMIGDDEMTGLADKLIDAFRDAARLGKPDWLSVWDDLLWQPVDPKNINNDNNILFGLTLEKPLHGVDRKYLYSFWRECFANRQQLYLIFVRAEPSVASAGGINDRSSSQMGGRAVALVWRDPAIPTYNIASRKKRGEMSSEDAVLDSRGECPPHRTRVLFYHQFD